MDQAIRYLEDNSENILGYLGYCDFTKEHLESYFYGEGGLKAELQRSLERLEKGMKPIFTRPLSIFKGETVTARAAEATALDEGRLRNMVKKELKEMLKSEECLSKIKEKLSSG
jgi:hypothetical protein